MKVVIDGWAWLPESEIDEVQRKWLLDRLTLIQGVSKEYRNRVTPAILSCYIKDPERKLLGIPREFFFEKVTRAHDIEYRVTNGREWPDRLPFVKEDGVELPKWVGAREDDPKSLTFFDTDLKINKPAELRSEQSLALDTAISHLSNRPFSGGIIQAPTAWGKCLGIGTPVLKFDGEIVKAEDIIEGDLLMGPDGKSRRVLSTTRGIGPLYRIVPKTGIPWVCNDAHILTLVHSITDDVVDIPLQDWIRLPIYAGDRKLSKHTLKQFSPPNGVEFSPIPDPPLDPYFLGVWYGDGTKSLNCVAITKNDAEIEGLCREIAQKYGLHVRVEFNHTEHPCATYFIHSEVGGRRNPLLNLLREIVGDGLRLPINYLRGSLKTRKEFFAGWIDTDGFHNNGCYEIVQKRRGWAEDLVYLARSLGLRANVKPKIVNGQTYWRIKFAGDFLGLPIRIPRKAPRKRLQKKIATRTGFNVESIGNGDYAGFVLDGDGRFLLGDFTVTHNTVWSLALIKQLRVKTAVLVHRKFLLDQWKNKISRFLPDAKVGVIYGNKWKIDDCHIVLVMIETLASWAKSGKVREEIAGEFGLVISDETHRAGAPTWSAAIPLMHAAKRIGISARPRRSDGLDKAFFYHIGPKIFTGHEQRLSPKIRRVWTKFKLNSERLNPSLLSKEMVVKIMTKNAAYNTDCVEQIKLALEAGRKVLIYSHGLEHLRRMKGELDSSWKGKPIKTDFFIGGMSEADLDEASKADALFASFQMCLDSLDIPDLDTVVLTTPIRNPEQPCGRVLRFFEGKKDPVVVDIRADAVPICKEYAETRDKFYERLYGEQQKTLFKAGS